MADGHQLGARLLDLAKNAQCDDLLIEPGRSKLDTEQSRRDQDQRSECLSGAPVDLSEFFLGVFVDYVRLLSLVVRNGHHAPRRRCAELQREADGLLVRLIAHQQSARQLALPWEQGKPSQACYNTHNVLMQLQMS